MLPLLQNQLQLPHIFTTSSPLPVTQDTGASSLQALYAQMGASPAPSPANASRMPSQHVTTSYCPFDHNHMQMQGQHANEISQEPSRDVYSQHLGSMQSTRAYPKGLDLLDLQGTAVSRPDYELLGHQLADAERSMQSIRDQGLLDHLATQEMLNWQRDFPQPEAVCQPLPESPLANAMEFDDTNRLDPGHHVSSYSAPTPPCACAVPLKQCLRQLSLSAQTWRLHIQHAHRASAASNETMM